MKYTLILSALIGFFSWHVHLVSAQPIVGMHILDPMEISKVSDSLSQGDDQWTYVTIPITTNDLDHKKWRTFFETAHQQKIKPIIRLATTYDPVTDAWHVPEKLDIVRFGQFFSAMPWSGERYIIMFNEPNHAKEWGGEVNPESYAEILRFAADWFNTEPFEYVVLPAGLDAAAPNGSETMDSFTFIDAMMTAEPDLLSKIDVWNSHAYPNPAFSSSAYRSAKNAIDGWEYELEYLSDNYGADLRVIITETGWDQRNISQWQLTQYYQYALEYVWNDSRVKGITPFILNGNNGVFNHFSFLLPDGSPSPQMKALIAAKQNISDKL